MKKSLLPFTLTMLIGSLLATGCGSKPTVTATPVPTTHPTSTPEFALPDLPAAIDPAIRFDPAVTEDPETLLLSGLIYDGLTRLDVDGNAQPALALSWTVSDDQLDYIVTLRRGVAFQSGSPFNADAVLANFNRWFDPADPLHTPDAFAGWETQFLGFKGDSDSNLQPLSPFDGIEKVDEHTVLIHLNRAVPDLMVKLAQPYFLMVDPGLLASAGESYGTSPESTSGTGAYKVLSWSDAGLELAPNPSAWGAAPATSLHFDWK